MPAPSLSLSLSLPLSLSPHFHHFPDYALVSSLCVVCSEKCHHANIRTDLPVSDSEAGKSVPKIWSGADCARARVCKLGRTIILKANPPLEVPLEVPVEVAF
jgi:hypothetical protein